MDIETLEREALKLPADERARLARELLDSLDEIPEDSIACGSKRRADAPPRLTPATLTGKRKRCCDELPLPPGGGSGRSRASRLLRVAATRPLLTLPYAFPANYRENLRDSGAMPSRAPVRRSSRTLATLPFDVLNREQNVTIQVLAIAHYRRRAGYWLGRVL